MKSLVVVAVAIAFLFGPCKKQTAPKIVRIYPVVVGEKTDLYEVLGTNELKLASGVRIKVVKGSRGEEKGFVFMRPNGGLGGFMACGCAGGTINSCKIDSDNPEHPNPTCSGGCVDGEGNSHACSLFGPIIGPPRDPFKLQFLARP
jgi:hypothetical protein